MKGSLNPKSYQIVYLEPRAPCFEWSWGAFFWRVQTLKLPRINRFQVFHGNLRYPPPPKKLRFPQEIAGPNSRPYLLGNHWLIIPDHKAGYLLGGPRFGSRGTLDSMSIGGLTHLPHDPEK